MENSYFESPENRQIIHEYMFVNGLQDQNDTKENLALVASHYDALADKFAEKEFDNRADMESFMFDFEQGEIDHRSYEKADQYLADKGFKGFESEFGFVPLMLAGALADKKTRDKLVKGAGKTGKFLAKKIKGGAELLKKVQGGTREQNIVDNKGAILETGRAVNQAKALDKTTKKQEDAVKQANRLLAIKRKAINQYGASDPIVGQVDQALNSKYTSISVVDALEDAVDRYKASEKEKEINKMMPTFIAIAIVLVVAGYFFGKK